VSKWYLAVGALDRGWWPLVFVIVTSSFLALVYIGRVLEVAWLREPGSSLAEVRDPPASMLVPIIILAAATVYLGLDTQWSAGIASTAAKSLIEALR
jgi:multicomponent Na+:H+ antiporter subunit D